MSDLTPQHDPLYTINEVARACRVSRDAIERWIEKGALAVIRLPNGQIRIRQSALDALKLPRPTVQ